MFVFHSNNILITIATYIKLFLISIKYQLKTIGTDCYRAEENDGEDICGSLQQVSNMERNEKQEYTFINTREEFMAIFEAFYAEDEPSELTMKSVVYNNPSCADIWYYIYKEHSIKGNCLIQNGELCFTNVQFKSHPRRFSLFQYCGKRASINTTSSKMKQYS